VRKKYAQFITVFWSYTNAPSRLGSIQTDWRTCWLAGGVNFIISILRSRHLIWN